jgi:ABC-type multidrug transport system ATPase subunit
VRRNRIHDNAFVENLEQIAVVGSGEFFGNDFTVEGRGNYWSDYTGFDLSDDGFGDMPYTSQSLFENLIDRQTKLRFFLFSPAQQAIEMASKAVPTFKPRPKVSDSAPLMSLPKISGAPLVVSPPWRLGAFAGFLALGSIATLGASRMRWSRLEAMPQEQPHVAIASLPGPILTISSLTKKFGKFVAVQDLSWKMERGEAVALWGRNGAGKTTAIKCILGLLQSEGRIVVAGYDAVREGKRVRAAIGYVPQELALPADMGTLEALAFYSRLKKVPRSRAQEALAEVEMLEHAGKRIGQLSGGMKQRVALAVALLSDPPLLVLDEMTSNLDSRARNELLLLLVRQKKLGKTILFTSHRPSEVKALADRVLILEQGRLVADCGAEEIPMHSLADEE